MTRHQTAFLTAPAAAVLTFWGEGVLLSHLAVRGALPAGAVRESLTVTLAFGLPVAYLGALLFVWPLYRRLRARGPVRPGTVVLLGAGGSAAWVALLMTLLVGAAGWLAVPTITGVAAVGSVAGVGGALAFLALSRGPADAIGAI